MNLIIIKNENKLKNEIDRYLPISFFMVRFYYLLLKTSTSYFLTSSSQSFPTGTPSFKQ